jgi:acetyltransferase
MMKLMIDYARSEGLKSLTGQVLRGNLKMLEMCQALSFSVGIDPTDAGLCEVSLPLGAEVAGDHPTRRNSKA